MKEYLMNKQLQKYFPYLLIIITLIFGVFLLLRKKTISLPFFSKAKTVELKKPTFVELLFSGNEYKLLYNTINPTNYVKISKFDKEDQWQGEGNIEKEENKKENILTLIDRNRSGTIT